jgi:hypothetical protein
MHNLLNVLVQIANKMGLKNLQDLRICQATILKDVAAE